MNNSSFKKHHNKKLVDESFLREAIRSILIKSEASSVLTEGTQKVTVGYEKPDDFTVHNSNSNSIPGDAASLFSGTYVLDVSDLNKGGNLEFTKSLADRIGANIKESGTGIGENVLYSIFNNIFEDLGNKETVVDCLIRSPIMPGSLSEQVYENNEKRNKKRREYIAQETPVEAELRKGLRNNARRKEKIDKDGSLELLTRARVARRGDKISLIKPILSLVGKQYDLKEFVSYNETETDDFCLKFYEIWEEVLLAKSNEAALNLLIGRSTSTSVELKVVNLIQRLTVKDETSERLFKYISYIGNQRLIKKFAFQYIKEKLASMKDWSVNPGVDADGKLRSYPANAAIKNLFYITWHSLVTGDAALERIRDSSQRNVFEVKSSILWSGNTSFSKLKIKNNYSKIIKKMKTNPQWTDFGWIWCFKVGKNEIHWYTTRRITCTLDELEKVPEEEREEKVSPLSYTFGKIFGPSIVAKPFFKLLLVADFGKKYKTINYIPPEVASEETVSTPESTTEEEYDLPEREKVAIKAILDDLAQLGDELRDYNASSHVNNINEAMNSWSLYKEKYLDPNFTEAKLDSILSFIEKNISKLLNALQLPSQMIAAKKIKSLEILSELVVKIENLFSVTEGIGKDDESTKSMLEAGVKKIGDWLPYIKDTLQIQLEQVPEESESVESIMYYESKKRLKENKKLKNGCIPARRRISSGGKTGSYANARTGGKQAYSALKKVKPPSKTKNICCHKCPNDRSAPNGYVCTNPAHLYWGTKGDNTVDQHHGNGTASKNESELRSDIKAYVLELLDERSSKKVTLTKKKLRALIFEAVGAAYFGDDFLEFKRKTESGEFPWDVLRDMGSKAKYVGEGSTRFVYQFADSPDFVVKIINWPKGRDPEEQASTGFKRSNMIDSNKWESDLLIQQRYTEVFPRTYEVAKDHSWILVETVDPIPDYATLFNIMGIDDTIFPANKKVLRMLFIELIADCIEVFQNPGSDMRSIIFKSDLLDEATGMSDFDSYDLSDEDVTIKDPALIKPKEALTPARRSYLETVKKIVDNKQNAKILGAMGSLGIPPREFSPKNLGLSRITKKLVILDASLWEEYTGEKS